jgi:hypothetical protein
MLRRSFLTLAAGAGATPVLAALPSLAATPERTVSGPVRHQNLAIYFVHGAGRAGPVPLTLQEALAQGRVTLRETGNVNELILENHGDEEVYVQSGDIVKGGKQDRVLTVSLIVPSRSGPVPVASYCVEQGRWASRGSERADRFSAADAAIPSRDAKLAMKAPLAASGAIGRSETGRRQEMVWGSVSRTQVRLAESLRSAVTATESRTSLQLSLENRKLKDAAAAYVAALIASGTRADDVLGFAFAVNGRINSADLYPSNGLFRKMWPKLLEAASVEAIGELGKPETATPSGAAVGEFLAAAERGQAERKTLAAGNSLDTRAGEAAYYFETRRSEGKWVHRNYIAR